MSAARRMWLRAGLLSLAVWLVPTAPGSTAELDAQTPKHNCSFCHNLHGAGAGTLSDFAVSQDLCLSCHDPLQLPSGQVDRDGTLVDVPPQVGLHGGDLHAPGDTTSCWNCHDHEGSAGSNLFMIPETRADLPQGGSAAIVFTTNAAREDYAGPDRVCAVCHTDAATSHTQSPGSPGHNGSDLCTVCHTHDGGFQPAGGGCTGCHSSTQLASGHTHPDRRQVVQDAGDGGGDFVRASAHIPDASVTDDDCVVCHAQRDSHSGDNLGVLLFDHDSGDSIQIAHGEGPDTLQAQAALLEQFCLGCHGDANAGATAVTFPAGSSATQPFSGLATIPLVDSTDWAASSHSTTTEIQAGCYGNGAFGCHGNGHGSEKLNLLAPFGTAPDPVTLYEEEEGFCFACHSGSGSSTFNIESQFATTPKYVEQPAGMTNSTRLNDRHDVQHTVATVTGAKIECADCHDPHAANATNRLRTDPDPGDGIVPAAEARMGAGSGSDWQTEWCLDCHDNSFPTGVRPGNLVLNPGDTLVDIATSWLDNDKHGAVSANNTSLDTDIRARDQTPETSISDWAKTDFLQCLSCHKTHPDSTAALLAIPGERGVEAADTMPAYQYNNLFQIKNRTYTKDGLTMIPVDPAYGGTTTPATSQGWELTINTGDWGWPTRSYSNGFLFCNTCHYNHMGSGKDQCYTTCHVHGGSKF